MAGRGYLRARGNHDFRIGYEGWHGDDLAYFAGRYSQPIFAYTNIINLINDNPFTETNIAFNPVTGAAVCRQLRLRENHWRRFC